MKNGRTRPVSNGMKRVLIFSYAYFPKVGGAEVALKEITNRISEKEFEFDMVTRRFDTNDSSFEKIGNMNVHRIYAGAYFFPFLAYWKARKLHAKISYDLTISVMANYAGFAALFFKISFPKVPFFLNLQEGDPIDYIKNRVRYVSFLFKKIFTRADFIQAISHYLEDFAKSMGATCPIEVVPNGVDVEKFQKRDIDTEDKLRQELGIFTSEQVIMTTSRLVKKNATEDLIAAMRFLPENTRLVLVGGGELEGELKAQVASLKLEKKVIFTGHVPHDLLPAYLQNAYIFCRPSLSEGLGVSFIETMAAGVPIVATPVGGIPDFLVDGETGLFCEVGDPKSIAEKISMLLEDSALRSKIIVNAKILSEKYDWNLIADKMQSIFFKLTK